jgi:hypothetical protein
MRLNLKKVPIDRGSTLAITLITCTILATLVGSYFTLIETQNRSVARSQNWNQALTVAEAGVEETLALLNSGVQPPNFAVFPWTSAGGGVFKNDTNRPGCKFGSSYYQAFITNGFAGASPVIISRGYVPGPIGSPTLVRTVLVGTEPRPTFPVKAPMIVMQTYNSNGNNVNTDSFDSSLGPYNPATAGTNGDVVSLSTNANSVVVGNGKIHGSVRTPPGGVQGVTATVGSGGSVGDSTWVNGGSTGFESDHFRDDFTLADFPDAMLPNVNAWLTPMGGTAPDGLYYNNLLPGGNYSVGNLTGSVYVGATNTVLYVTTSISVGSSGGSTKNGYAPPEIHIAPGASLTLYMAGATTTIGGNGIVNDGKLAPAFAYYGLPSNTSINIKGNGAFYGTIYAPEADFTLKGSGSGTTDDFTGASVTRTTMMSGNFNFHYDQSTSLIMTLGGYDPVSWTEL